MIQIKGYVEIITFTNHDNGFTVAKLREDSSIDLITIIGYMPSIQVGETLNLKGNWKTHVNFGKQFEVKEFSVEYPSDLIGIEKYLESGLVKGIGPVYAKKIVDKFKLNTLEIIDQTPFRLLEVEGIGRKRIEKIKSCWDEQKSIRHIIIFLRSNGVSPAFAQKIYKTYQEKSIEVVKNNPYVLARDISGIGFKIADNIAKKLGFKNDSPLRIESGIEYVLYEMTNQGHTCYPKNDFLPIAQNILEVEEDLVASCLNDLIQKNKILEDFLDNTAYIWLKSLFLAEQSIAREINRIKNSKSSLREIALDKAINWIQNKLNLKFASQQIEAINKSSLEKLHIITGGPGTGKSTITNAILKISQELTNKIVLCAPTGKAAKRLTQITKRKAFTIHALLEFDFTTGKFKKNQEMPLKCDLIIIDEASMIDTLLMYHLLKAIPSHARVIFVGDIDQLPSIGPGNVLKDMINSSKIEYTTLNEIFRQAKTSQIIVNAHRINSGLFPEIIPYKKDFQLIALNEVNEIKDKILELTTKEIPDKKKFDPIDDIQILSPMKKGEIGTENLNTILQNALNPSDKPLFKASQRFHLNDKVMQIKNNYNKKVFNGDVGKIIQIDSLEQLVIVAFDDKLISYEFTELDELVLAYAVSVHKYQGSECKCVIIPLHTCHYKLLFRNLLYTAITRGKKQVIVVGMKKALAIAIKNNDVGKRHTGLEKSLKVINSYNQQTMLPGFNL